MQSESVRVCLCLSVCCLLKNDPSCCRNQDDARGETNTSTKEQPTLRAVGQVANLTEDALPSRAPKYLGGTVEQTALVMLFSSFSAGGKGFEKTYSCL